MARHTSYYAMLICFTGGGCRDNIQLQHSAVCPSMRTLIILENWHSDTEALVKAEELDAL